MAKSSDEELMRVLEIDKATLDRFRKIQQETIKEAKQLNKRKWKIKVLGISGSARDENDMAKEKSNSEMLLEECLSQCRKLRAETELIPLRNYKIEHCKACYSTTNTQCHCPCSCYPRGTPLGDDMSNVLYDKILYADAIIFATPVNNFKISTLLAAFIDRCISLDGSLRPANPNNPKDVALNIKHMKFIELTSDSKVAGSGLLKRFIGKTAGIIVTGHEEGASMVITQLFMALNHFGMAFPPFSNMYAMASVCNSTYADKPIVLSDCYKSETMLLAKNVMTTAKMQRAVKNTEWKYEYTAD
jgi:multimeric flavodoxin WrbA